MATKELVRGKPDTTIRVMGKQMTSSKAEENDVDQRTCRSAKTSVSGSHDGGAVAELSAVEQVMSINRKLVAQIETLRLKVEVDARQHERVKAGLLSTTQNKVKVRELEIENLKTTIEKKEDTVKTLSAENERKGDEISVLQGHLDVLREDLRGSRTYVDEIQKQLGQLEEEKQSLEVGTAYSSKDKQISDLQREVNTLQKHLETMEQELIKAKDKISLQGGKLRQADLDKSQIQVRFKGDLAKVTQTVRKEVERTREVMRAQWEEIRELRQQNEDMRSDIREIRELLTADLPVESPVEKLYGHSQSPYSLQTASPSLPALSRTQQQHGRRLGQGRKQ
ncbi:60 kDa neurofilament protein [Aplysia californica]|uniref:60 kDa neurofilament protein n=1 Tax=Aplysia californica TaxID=6500 RepID=A0ABM1A904_APLCA|nr:60 kDa neurofilament protein [Aplysia californica]